MLTREIEIFHFVVKKLFCFIASYLNNDRIKWYDVILSRESTVQGIQKGTYQCKQINSKNFQKCGYGWQILNNLLNESVNSQE